MPIISVLMTVYNGQEFLKEAIQSILDQTFTDFEFIIIDDGSTDNSSSIIHSYSDRRIKYYYKENRGLAVALNYGISKCNCLIIARMDADDISFPDRLMIQYKYMTNNPRVDLLGGQVQIIDNNGTIVGAKYKPVGFMDIKKSIEYGCPINHPTYMVKKSVYEKLKGYRESLIYAQDYDFLLRAYDSGFILENTKEFLLFLRVLSTSGNNTKDFLQMRFTRWILELHRSRIRNNCEPDNILSKISDVQANSRWWFNFLNKYRSDLLLNLKKVEGFKRGLVLLAITFISCLHLELLYSTLRVYRFKNSWPIK